MEQAKVLPFTTPNHNNYNNNAHTRVEDLQILDQTFADVFGYPMRPYHRKVCLRWIGEGVDWAVIDAAIIQTAGAPFPSWRYTEAIIGNCIAWGVLTPMQWLENQQRHYERSQKHADHQYR